MWSGESGEVLDVESENEKTNFYLSESLRFSIGKGEEEEEARGDSSKKSSTSCLIFACTIVHP